MSTWSYRKYTQVKGKTYVSHSELNQDWWTNKVHQFPTASTVWKFVWFLGTLSNLNQIFNRLTEWQFAFLPSWPRMLAVAEFSHFLCQMRGRQRLRWKWFQSTEAGVGANMAFFCRIGHRSVQIIISWVCSDGLITTGVAIIIIIIIIVTIIIIILNNLSNESLTRCGKKGDPSELLSCKESPTALWLPHCNSGKGSWAWTNQMDFRIFCKRPFKVLFAWRVLLCFGFGKSP